MAEALIELRKLSRAFPAGEGTITVLKDIDLAIGEGEMVAIVGASGSGKSTLMNILGCLDRPTGGSYAILGRQTAELEPDELAALRREHFGFIFQRYHLLPELTAAGNAEIPAIYAGRTRTARGQRAAALLGRLGMAERLDHRPNQLSGGQQQRVSIARALMNDPKVILADEPTGALDSHTGEEVLRILEDLNAEGRTIIIVTHDMAVARRASRIIEIRDGVIISDRANARPARADGTPAAPAAASSDLGAGAAASSDLGAPAAASANPAAPAAARGTTGGAARGRGLGMAVALDRLREALAMAVLSMRMHKLRTFLTMLGIVIGIASVVCVVALGTGSQQKVLENISNLGTNTLEIFPGSGFGDVRSGRVRTLVLSDADALGREPYAAAVTPTVSTSLTTRYDAVVATAQVSGVGVQYFDVRGSKLAEGRFFDSEDLHAMAQVAVIDENTRSTLFGSLEGSPVGKVILVGDVFTTVIGVTKPQTSGFGSSQNLTIFMPYTTVQTRITGSNVLRSITVRVSDDADSALAQQAVTDLLLRRHGTQDFTILNTDDIRETITSTTQTLALLIAAIAIISLVVGGIGVMNIMLVTVSERTGEIGVRMAVGARQADILQQFLIEAVLVCMIGGLCGIAAALGFGVVFSAFSTSFRLVYSSTSIVAAVGCSTLIGVVFGYLPARSASQLDPIVALSRD